MSSSRASDDRLDAAIAEYLEAERLGPVDTAAFLRRHESLQSELVSFLKNRAEFQKVAGAVEPPTIGIESSTNGPLRVRYFGDYELMEEIARGGMGVVYKARQVSLNRIVALKLILAGQFSSPVDVQRFRAEAEAAANLDHPNIVPIYEVGEHDGQQYFSMKYVEGGTFAEDKSQGSGVGNQESGDRNQWPGNDLTSRIEILAKVARAVHFAHQRGIIHRDIKPGNILLQSTNDLPRLTPDSCPLTPFIADFGLAKRIEGDSKQTKTGSLVGTPNYMAPEQARSEKTLTTAVDVYSLGAVLYELLTGRPPFVGPNPIDVVMQVLERDPTPPRQIQPEADRDLSTIALKCLEKDPLRRYASADALANELQRWLDGKPIQARPTTPVERVWKWARRRPAIAAMALLSVMAATGLVATLIISNFKIRDALLREGASSTESRHRLVQRYVADGTRAIEEHDPIAALPWLIEALPLVENDPDQNLIHRQRLGILLRQCARLTRLWSDGLRASALSPDGKKLLRCGSRPISGKWTSEARLFDLTDPNHKGVPLDGIADTNVDAPGRNCFSADGRHLVLEMERYRNCMIGRWDAQTGRLLSKVVPNEAFTPRVLDVCSARLVLFGERREHGTGADVPWRARVYDVATGIPLSPILAHEKGMLADGRFSPNGQLVVTIGTLFDEQLQNRMPGVRVWDATTGKKLVELPRISGGISHALFSPDSQILATVGDGGVIRFWKANDGAAIGTGFDHGESVRQLEFSSDGRRFVTASKTTVRVWHVFGSVNAEPLVWGENPAPTLSPDGKLLAVFDQNGLVHVVDIQSRRDIAFPIHHRKPGWSFLPVFLPDGRHLVTSGDDGTARLWDLAGGIPFREPAELMARYYGNPLRLEDEHEMPQLSRDGQSLAWLIAHDRVRVCDMTRPGRFQDCVFQGTLRRFGFSEDGGKLAVLAGPRDSVPVNESGEHRVYVWNLDTGHLAYGVTTLRATNLIEDDASETKSAGEFLRINPQNDRLLRVQFPASDPMSPSQQPGSGSSTSQIIDLATGQPSTALATHPGKISNAWFCADGSRYMLESANTLQVFATETGRPVCEPIAHKFGFLSCMSRNGQRLVATIMGEVAHEGRITHGTFSFQPPQPQLQWTTPTAWAQEFHPDGRRLLLGHNGYCRIWDSLTGKPVSPIMRNINDKSDSILPLATRFSDDGRLLIVRDQGYSIWETRSGNRIANPLGWAEKFMLLDHQFAINRTASSFSGIESSHHVWQCDLSADQRSVDELREMVRTISGQILDDTSSIVDMDVADYTRAAWNYLGRNKANDLYEAAWLRYKIRHSEVGDPWDFDEHESLTDKTAVTMLERLNQLEPNRWFTLMRLGFAYAGQKRWDDAIHAYTKAIECGGTTPGVYHHRGTLHAQRNQFREAAADLQHVPHKDGRPTAFHGRAHALLAAGDREGLKKYVQEVVHDGYRVQDRLQFQLWPGLLTDDSGIDLNKFAVALGQLPEADAKEPSVLLARAAIALRKGEPDMQELEKVREAVANGLSRDQMRVELFLALANQRMGKSAQATQHREAAKTALGNSEPDWMTRVEYQLLSDEYERYKHK